MHHLLKSLNKPWKIESWNNRNKNTDKWAKIISPVLYAYNNSPHSSTKIAPNKFSKDNDIQVLMNISKEPKKEHVLL